MEVLEEIRSISRTCHGTEYDALLLEETMLLAYVRNTSNPLKVKKDAMLRLSWIQDKQNKILRAEVA